ncbi:MAG: hypothetical protein EB090_00590 [Verrucomicrobia bacterium]|nr:hypothetical protein [Verrucomicrobiota bacterium]
MRLHPFKFQPLRFFGKLTASLIIGVFSGWATWAAEPATLTGQATIQLKNSSSPQKLAGMDLVLAPATLIPEIRRLRMETWRTEGLAVKRNADGEEEPIGVQIDFADGYKNLDLKAMSQAAANAATLRTKTDTNGVYTFRNATPGRYALYCQYKSRYAVAYWLLEVDVAGGKTNSLILCETNAAEIFNRFEKKKP